MPAKCTRLQFTTIISHLHLGFSAHPGLQACGSLTKVRECQAFATQEAYISLNARICDFQEPTLGGLRPAFSVCLEWLILYVFERALIVLE